MITKLSVVTRYHKYFIITYKDVCIFEIISPVRSDFSCTTDVPDVELEAFALHTFYIKSLCRSDLKKETKKNYKHKII